MSRRVVVWLGVSLLGMGCQSVEKRGVEPLPTHATTIPYADLVEHARRQLWAAQEIFYRDHWDELTKAGETLQETAQHLLRVPAERVPPRCRDLWPKPAEEFRTAAEHLRNCARQQDAIQCAQAFQKLHLVLRQIRPD
ncbi:MAG: hypothetical protein RMJ19_01320 [Gemmatales bacterium]|nr:hypothetical protein [Gemmatales bacterium]MDW8174286.1 hypothetical protein [Gemmatales bacterium]